MKRFIKKLTSKKESSAADPKAAALKKARELRAKLEQDHGELFEQAKDYAKHMHNGSKTPSPKSSASAPITESDLIIDKDKNIQTILKLIDDKGNDVNNAKFTKDIFALLQKQNATRH